MAANLKLERDDDRFGGKYYILAHQNNTALMSRGFYQRLDPFSFSTTGYFPKNTGMVDLLKFLNRLSGSNVQLLDRGVGK